MLKGLNKRKNSKNQIIDQYLVIYKRKTVAQPIKSAEDFNREFPDKALFIQCKVYNYGVFNNIWR